MPKIFLFAFCFGLSQMTSLAQIKVTHVSLQELVAGTTYHTRVHDSDTFLVIDSTANLIRTLRQVNGRLVGDYIEKDFNGRILLIARLNPDKLISGFMPFSMEPNYHGQVTVFHDNGQMACGGSYKNGYLHGERRKWDEGGRLVSKEVFANGFLDSTNYYYHKNSCAVHRIVRCRAESYYTDTIETKELSPEGFLTSWYVQDSILYKWNKHDGFYIKMYNSAGKTESEKWFTQSGILQKMDSFSYYLKGDTYETFSFSDKGILQYHKEITSKYLENISTDSAVTESEIKEWKYSKTGVLLKSNSRIERDTLVDVDQDYPEETEKVFEWYDVSELANPMGGYVGLSETLNKQLKDFKIKKKYKGQFTFDIRIEKNGKVSTCKQLNGLPNDKNLVLTEINNFLLSYPWKPHRERNRTCATVHRVSVLIK